MTGQKNKKAKDFEKQVYSFYRKYNIPFEDPPTKTPEEYGRAIVEEVFKNNFSDQKSPKIKLAGTTKQGKFI